MNYFLFYSAKANLDSSIQINVINTENASPI